MEAILHIESTYRLEQDGFGSMVTVVIGHSQPDLQVIQTLRATGGTWENQVEWRPEGQFYLVTGNFCYDPNYGDTPGDIDRRLRQVVGDKFVSIRIYHPDGSIVEDNSLLGALTDQPIPQGSVLDTKAALSFLEALDRRAELNYQRALIDLGIADQPKDLGPDIPEDELEVMKRRVLCYDSERLAWPVHIPGVRILS